MGGGGRGGIEFGNLIGSKLELFKIVHFRVESVKFYSSPFTVLYHC